MVAKLHRLGWDGPHYGKGRNPHPFMRKGKRKIPIPNDHGEAIGVPLLRRVIRIAEIDPKEWDDA